MDFGRLLKNLRKASRRTQKEVASQLGIPVSTLSDYERGYTTPSLERYYTLVNYYGINLESYFLGKEMLDITNYSKSGKQKAYALQNEEILKQEKNKNR